MGLTEKITIFAILAINIAILTAVCIYFLKSRKKREEIQHFGDNAERLVREYITEAFPGSVLLNNIYLNTGYGLTQLDHILVCRWGVYAIETKSHNGRIEIGEKSWTQKYKDKTITFHSPVKQNEIHKKALAYAIGSDRRLKYIPVNGIIVFTSHNVYFSRRIRDVIRLDELNSFIKKGEAFTGGYRKRGRKGVPVTSTFPNKYLLDKTTIEKVERLIIKKSVTDKHLQDEHRKTIYNYKYEHKK